jgi:hypothetical protein
VVLCAPSELLLESWVLWVCVFGNILLLIKAEITVVKRRKQARVNIFFHNIVKKSTLEYLRKTCPIKVHTPHNLTYQLTICNKSTYIFIVLQRGVTSSQWLLYQSTSYSLHLLPCTPWTLGQRWEEGGETRGSLGNQR